MALTPSEMSGRLERADRGGHEAASRLAPLVYTKLQRLAAHYLHGNAANETIEPTELVHEAYVRLTGGKQLDWEGMAHFMAMAATSMRRILVDRARRRAAEKRGGARTKVPLDDLAIFAYRKSEEILALDEAMHKLASFSVRQSRIVELRFFCGLHIDEIAKLEGVSPRTVKSDWSVARAWLHREMTRTS